MSACAKRQTKPHHSMCDHQLPIFPPILVSPFWATIQPLKAIAGGQNQRVPGNMSAPSTWKYVSTATCTFHCDYQINILCWRDRDHMCFVYYPLSITSVQLALLKTYLEELMNSNSSLHFKRHEQYTRHCSKLWSYTYLVIYYLMSALQIVLPSGIITIPILQTGN